MNEYSISKSVQLLKSMLILRLKNVRIFETYRETIRSINLADGWPYSSVFGAFFFVIFRAMGFMPFFPNFDRVKIRKFFRVMGQLRGFIKGHLWGLIVASCRSNQIVTGGVAMRYRHFWAFHLIKTQFEEKIAKSVHCTLKSPDFRKS